MSRDYLNAKSHSIQECGANEPLSASHGYLCAQLYIVENCVH